MGKYIKRATARKCPVHQAILDECGKRLVANGYFSKSAVLESLRFTAMEDSIRWDYIAGFLSEPEGVFGIELVPLAQKFFSSTRAERLRAGEHSNVGPYLAGGHGKKTAGYARVSFEGGLMALKRLENYKNMANGVGKTFSKYLEAIQREEKELTDATVKRIQKMGKAA